MDSIDAYRKITEQILSSESFRERDIYQKLLKYLVDSSFKNITPKEIAIAYDVFKKGKDFNPSDDTIVRVHIHNLRKMLDTYYQNEGMNEKTRLRIPKGHYRVEFDTNKEQKKISGLIKRNRLTSLLFICLIFTIGFILLDKLYFQTKFSQFNAIESNNPVWGKFFNNGYPSSVVIGDFLVFHEYDDRLQRSRRIQDYSLNTEDELEQYANSHPSREVEKWIIGELPHNSIQNIIDIQPVFLSFDQELALNFTSEIDINFIKNRNVIYVGEFKNLRVLSDLVANLPVKYETLPWWHGTISFTQNDSQITLKTSHDWEISRYVVDLAMVAKLPGQNHENYLIIAGFGYNAQVKAVQVFCKKPSLDEMEEEIKSLNGSIPDYFVMVLEVTGFDRASTLANIKYFHEINAEEYQQDLYPGSSN